MANAANSSTTKTCASCEEDCEVERLYKCVQCNTSDCPEKPVEFMCELCISVHIKKGHSVLDHRSLEPAVCQEHKQLCLDYCITCNEIFCSRCLGKHRKHDFQSLNENASDMRAKVFELLNDWEKNEKVALEKGEDVSTIVDIHKMEVEKLVKEVEGTLDKVKENLTAEIRSKFREFEDVQSWIERHVASVGQVQSDLRGLLCQSNGNLVNSFPTVEAKIGALSTSDSQVKLYQMNKEQFEAREGFKSLNQRIISEISKELSLPGVSVEFSRELSLDKVVYREPTMEKLFEAPEGFKSLNQELFSDIHEQFNLLRLKNESLEPSSSVKNSKFQLKAEIAETAESSSQHQIKKTSKLKAEIGETPKLSSELRFKSIAGCFTDNCFEVAQRNRRLEVRKYDTKKRNFSDAVCADLALPDAFLVERVYYLNGQILVVGNQPMRPKRAFCYYLENRKREMCEIPYPLNYEVLGARTGEGGWIYWDHALKSISVWLNSDGNIRVITRCQSRPTNQVVSDCNLLCFYDQSAQKIISIEFSSNYRVDRFYHYDRENLDCISTFLIAGKLIIVTWSVQSRASSVYVLSVWSLNQPERVLQLDWRKNASFDVYPLQFVLRPLNCDKRDEDKCLFLIERIE